jgi:FAD synthetase
MSLEETVDKYVSSALQVFQQLGGQRKNDNAARILDHAKRYLDDALYYRGQKRFETALASIAYCEGLLDALRLLEMVEFQWPTESKANVGRR